ncbi:hypothetical protein [Actinomyces sp. oral taxon 448]|jgi:hypothetical protein|uniref:hypothetical protein n=1 Tax=Actinomyces sp. oral taxon 448 TaxID=712124 RepID=UPI0005589B97|nr:hypothetical protein [Actinomyces sp. oral taxon 448]
MPAPVDDRPEVRGVEDRRRPAHGWGRLLVVVFAVFGLAVLAPAAVALVRTPTAAPVVGSINVAVGLLFILLAVCVAHNGRRMRLIGWMSLSALLTGAALIGVLTWTDAAEGLEASVWADGGRQLCYLPLLLPLMAAGWMWLSNPRRIVINAERMDELGATLAERRHSADR